MSLQPDLLGSEVEELRIIPMAPSTCWQPGKRVSLRAAELNSLIEAVKEEIRHPKKSGVETNFQKQKPILTHPEQ